MASNNSINNQALNGFTASGGTINIAADAIVSTTNIGTGAAAKATNVGSTTAGSNTTLQAGSGGGILYVGSNATAQSITMGNSVASTSVDIVGGASAAVNINSSGGFLSLLSGTGNLNISQDTAATTVNIASSAAAKTLTMGSINTTSATTIQAGSGNIVLSGGVRYNLTSTSTTPYAATSSDYIIAMDSSGGAKTVQLPNAPSTGRTFVIKDSTGSASTNNITVTTVGGAVNIDGATTYVINSAYQSITVVFNGTSYLIL